MKLGVMTVCLSSLSLDEACRYLKEQGVQQVEIGLRRQQIYITNSVKCRPPQNRDPLNTEKDACSGYLRRQLELMQPKILVCLGRISAAEIIKPDFKITQEHGQFFEKDGMQMMALYHPAALLRDPGKKPETFEDLKRLQARIREVCVRTELTFA